MITSLENAVRRGVDVRLLVPGKSDIPAASYAGRALFMRLLKAGVKIYTYLGEMLHAKVYLFDQYWSIIGSTNLDYQSLMYNDEGNVGILDQGFASKMAEVFAEDLTNSVKVDDTKGDKMKLMDLLRKLGIFRSGSTKATYKDAKERPIELQESGVFDSKKDLVKNKKDK